VDPAIPGVVLISVQITVGWLRGDAAQHAGDVLPAAAYARTAVTATMTGAAQAAVTPVRNSAGPLGGACSCVVPDLRRLGPPEPVGRLRTGRRHPLTLHGHQPVTRKGGNSHLGREACAPGEPG
jgi:hypothetical protein